ncbi:hypothetical protein PPERSA_03198 [Pseudocohnilembus persalinus]|uniref:protein-tyrosine-phosphatase n=1 Tax=Pseudocohnilembus persalinus TaxID=266149 RepID=A0A0V0QE32_PSEPJ|nr:hypothetical protein PPERSA_03198 [Pseudocohnilembus persalinus]|eukprot:KRX00465.1 hypothetical protein PPERSA_03198 [Pseudocohnilembus persalinus]
MNSLDLQYLRYDQDLNHIWKNVWLGDRSDSENLQKLQKADITHILITGNNLKAFYPDKFKYKVIPLENYNWNANLMEVFDEAVEFIKQGNCFIHCIAGMHRSPTFTIAYLIKEGKMTVQEAYNLTKQKRSLIDPPERFIEQLYKYQFQNGIQDKIDEKLTSSEKNKNQINLEKQSQQNNKFSISPQEIKAKQQIKPINVGKVLNTMSSNNYKQDLEERYKVNDIYKYDYSSNYKNK